MKGATMTNVEKESYWAQQQRLLATVQTRAYEGLRLVPFDGSSPTVGQLRRYVYPAYAKLIASIARFPNAPKVW